MALKYTSVQKLVNLLSERQLAQLSDDTDVSDDEISTDNGRIEQFLAYAEATVESYIQTRFPLPLEPIPTTVEYAALVIAKYRLMLRREYMTEEIGMEYKGVMDWLRAVKMDDADLYPTSDTDAAEVTYGTSVNTAFGPDWFTNLTP